MLLSPLNAMPGHLLKLLVAPASSCSSVSKRLVRHLQAEEADPPYEAVTFSKNANLGRCGGDVSCMLPGAAVDTQQPAKCASMPCVATGGPILSTWATCAA